MENQQNNITLAAIMRKSKSESLHGRALSLAQSNTDESPQSPLRFHSPRSDQPLPPEPSLEPSPENSPENSYSKAIVPVDKYYRSPLPERPKPVPTPSENANAQSWKIPSPVVVFNRAVRENQTPTGGTVDSADVEGRRRPEGRSFNTIPRGSDRGDMVTKAALGFRVCEVVFCLISFSVMAADKTQGWSGDSFDRYKEYRYCLSVTVLAFVYSGFQAYDIAYHLITGKHVIQHHLRYHFDFFMDQILAYLLISASSSAATRVDDWQSNWGKDQFTEMASASISMAFLAFIAFALSSFISGFNLCNRNIT